MENREIKFRAWDNGNGMIYQDGNKICAFFGDDSKVSEYGNDEVPDYLVLMQYTGLKDKNGKEIYEGDIVTVHVTATITEWKHKENMKVVFKCGCFCLENERRGYILHDKCKTKPLNNYYECEVIGNVFENPELLK